MTGVDGAERLLDREDQRAALLSYADDARSGNGRLVLVSGEAGVGKSSLIESLQPDLADARWLQGACDGQFTPRALGPLRDIADQAGGRLVELCARDGARELLFAAFLDLLRDAAGLVVVVIEDVHWADEATLDLLRFLGRRLSSLPALLLVSYRDDALEPADSLRIALGELAGQRATRRLALPPLSAAAVAALAAESGLDAEQLHRLTGGNAFFITEVLRTGGTTLPTSARDAVLARVARLGPTAREALEVAALIGTRVDADLLATVTDTAMDAMDEVVRAGLLCGDRDGMRFRHEIARLAVASEISPHRRRAGHQAILGALRAAGCEDAARLAFHAEGAGAAGAAAFARRAGDDARALGAHREAAVQYERSLRLGGDDDECTVASLGEDLAEELALVDRWEDAAEARQRAIKTWQQVGDVRREGEGLRRLSTVMWRLCRGAESQQALMRSIELLEPLGPNRELARAYAAQAFTVWMSDQAAGERMLHLALEMSRELGIPALQSDVLNNVAFAAFLRDEVWLPQIQEALRIALDADATEQAGRAYANAYAFLVSQHRFAEAERYWRDGIVYCDERDITTFSTCLRGRRAVALAEVGRWDEAAAVAEHVLATEASPVNLLTSQVSLGLILARRGEPGADELLDAAVRAADGLDEGEWIAFTRQARAEAAWLVGNCERAGEDLRHARGSITAINRYESAALALWEYRVLGVAAPDGPVGEPIQAELAGEFGAAAKRWDEVGCGYAAALALAGSSEEDDLRAALERLDGLGARATSTLVRRRMRELGIRSVPVGARAATRSHPRGLTRREQEVLERLVAGDSNEQIARHLTISVKTVDHHVSAVLGKLDVADRQAAARVAREHGLAGRKVGNAG